MNLMSLKEINAFLKKNKLKIQYDIWDRTSAEFSVRKATPSKLKYDSWGYIIEDNDGIGFNVGQTTFSCGVPEFGDFGGDNKHEPYWQHLIQYFIRKYLARRINYFRCTTIVDQKAVNEALESIGFEKRAELKSKHGKHKIYVWELIVK